MGRAHYCAIAIPELGAQLGAFGDDQADAIYRAAGLAERLVGAELGAALRAIKLGAFALRAGRASEAMTAIGASSPAAALALRDVLGRIMGRRS